MVEKIATGFVYTNDGALSPEEEFLLIAETGRARVHRLRLNGLLAGERELFLDNLPGYPDNIEAQGDGTYWIALASPRVPVEALMPFLVRRKSVWRLAPIARPAPIEKGHLLQVDGEGRVLCSLQDPSADLGITTGGRVIDGQLYVMTLDSPGLGRVPLATGQ